MATTTLPDRVEELTIGNMTDRYLLSRSLDVRIAHLGYYLADGPEAGGWCFHADGTEAEHTDRDEWEQATAAEAAHLLGGAWHSHLPVSLAERDGGAR